MLKDDLNIFIADTVDSIVLQSLQQSFCLIPKQSVLLKLFFFNSCLCHLGKWSVCYSVIVAKYKISVFFEDYTTARRAPGMIKLVLVSRATLFDYIYPTCLKFHWKMQGALKKGFAFAKTVAVTSFRLDALLFFRKTKTIIAVGIINILKGQVQHFSLFKENQKPRHG